MTDEEFAHWARNSIQSSNANAMRFNSETGKLERMLPELTAEQVVVLHTSGNPAADLKG